MVKTQSQYDKEHNALTKVQKAFVQRTLSRDMTVAQLCIMGYSVDRAYQLVSNWQYDEENKLYIFDGRS